MSERAETALVDRRWRLIAAAGVRSRQVGSETVLLDLERSFYYSLNAAGSTIWQGLLEGCTLGAIHERLVATYEADAATLWRDLEVLVGDLVEHELVRRADDEPA